jgi:uncharacterized protein (DUF885 family)
MVPATATTLAIPSGVSRQLAGSPAQVAFVCVDTEVDRHICWPGQALAYKLGELTIRRLRTEAETQLGPKFDEKRFHDAILGLGSVPLTVLEGQMHAFIREEAARKP